MKRLFFVFLTLLCFHVAVDAQKKALDQARTYIKSGKNLDKAEKLMSDLLCDSVSRKNEKIWITLADALRKQYEQGNEKLYLKQKVDTASLFNTAKKLFAVLEGLDSLDATPDSKGRVNIKYRDRHADYLNTYRPNLYNAGSYFLRNSQYAKAFEYYDAYLDCAVQPLFGKFHYIQCDTLMPEAAFWALYAGYKLGDYHKTVKYRNLAEKDSARLDNVLIYLAETYLQQRDTAEYVRLLQKGFEHHPDHPFFFPRLIDYYNGMGLADSARVIIDTALASDSLNQLFLFAKSTALLNEGNYDQCITLTQRLLQLNDSLPEAYCNIGLAYYNQALQIEATMARSKKKRKAVNALYEKSRPFIEQYRAMRPDQKAKWLAPLYAIYLNLNMGKEFEEIDKMIQK